MNWEKIFVSKLLIAIPEIAWSDELIDLAIRLNVLSKKELENLTYWKRQVDRTRRIGGKLSSKTFSQRLLILAPELISTKSIDMLRRLKVLDEVDGHRLRLLVRAMTVTGIVPGAIPSNRTLRERLGALSGVVFSQETIDLFRLVPIPGLGSELTVKEADFLRGVLIGAERLNAARRVMGAGDGLIEQIMLVGAELLNERVVRAGMLTGAISSANGRKMLSFLKLGTTAWRTANRVWNASGFEQRALIASTGLMSQELISFLRSVGIIDKNTARILGVTSQMARSLAKSRLESIQDVRRSYRVLPGESPIATFARTSRSTDRDILDLLNSAAEETRERIAALAKDEKIGAKARAAQERILLNSLYNEIRALWEGIGYLTIVGEDNAAKAAIDSMDFLSKNLWRRTGAEGDLVRRQLREAGRAGVDSLISREENVRALSSAVYKNIAFSNNLIARRIQINLLRGVSAKEFADDIAKLIRPDVRGGVSYAAFRLARTEINNAFHITTIRYTREQPWVTGYRWNLSATHRSRTRGGTDVCDDYASDDHDGLGAGLFKKSTVPSKPHPHCLCFVTPEVMDSESFRRNYRSGTFNRYLDARKNAGLFDATPPSSAAPGLVTIQGPV